MGVKISKIDTPSPGWGGSRQNAGGPRPGAGRPRKAVSALYVAPLQTVGQRWHVAKTKYRSEKQASEEIEKLNLEVFWPREKVVVRRLNRAGQRVNTEVVRPLFPGYLFVRFDAATEGWRHIPAKCQSVWQLIMTGRTTERPIPVPESFMRKLIADLPPDGIVDRCPPPKLPAMAIGARVKLIDGPFGNASGIVQWSSRKRVGLLLEIMGQPKRVEVKRHLVEAVAA
jgi:transcription antitermination factor NusG